MNFKQYVLSLRIIHLALIMGVCFICLALFFVNGGQEVMESTLAFNENFLFILAVIPWFGSRIAYRSGIAKIPSIQGLGQKLMHYRKTLIFSLAIAEGVTILSVILYFFIAPSSVLLFVIATGMVSMLLLGPSETRIINELQLYPKEEKQLKDLLIPTK